MVMKISHGRWGKTAPKKWHKEFEKRSETSPKNVKPGQLQPSKHSASSKPRCEAKILGCLICVISTYLNRAVQIRWGFFGPQSPRAKFLRNFSKRSAEKCGEILAKFSQIFVLQFPGKMAAKNFTKNPRHFPRCTKLNFFHCCNSGGLGAQGLEFAETFSLTLFSHF